MRDLNGFDIATVTIKKNTVQSVVKYDDERHLDSRWRQEEIRGWQEQRLNRHATIDRSVSVPMSRLIGISASVF